MIRAFLLAAVLALLAGCAGDTPPPVVVTAEPPRPVFAPECDAAGDPSWISRDRTRDVYLSDEEARDAANRRNFNTLKGRRRICDVGLKEQAR